VTTMLACLPGSDAGRWADGGREWHSSRAGCPLRNFLSRGRGGGGGARAAAHEWRRLLSNKSVLLIGDSTDREKCNAFCDLFGTPATSYVPGLHLTHAHGNSGYGSCTVHGLTVGQFMHYGVMDKPYFRYAYPVPPPLHDDAYEHLARDAVLFRRRIRGADPTLVVVQSYAWDIAAECQRAGGGAVLHTEEKVRDWVRRVASFLAHVRSVFPSSSVAWRTSHPYSAYCAHPALLRSMNAAAREALPRLGYAIMEWGEMMEASSDAACKGELHVTPQCNLPYVNRLLNVIAQSSYGPDGR